MYVSEYVTGHEDKRRVYVLTSGIGAIKVSVGHISPVEHLLSYMA